MSKKSRIAIFTKKKAPAGCQLQAKDSYFPKSTDSTNCLHFSIQKNRILQITISTIATRQKNQIGQNINFFIIYIRGAGGRGEALR